MELKELALERAKTWLSDQYDEQTRQQVQQMIDQDSDELVDAFYKDLEFGTGGMRGIMGVGTNRMNRYTIGAATQGLADYLKEQFPGKPISVVIGCDVRHNSDTFSRMCAEVFSANGIKAYLFDGFRPTPEISFAIRYLHAQSGIIITASHNPPKYNGYKAYWDDGSQVVPPHDTGIIDRVAKVHVGDIRFTPDEQLIETIGPEVDRAFVEAAVEHGSCDTTGRENFKLVYTPIHGTSFRAMIPALDRAGFHYVTVKEQMVPSGDFPTVQSPNPENPEALKMATDLAIRENADMVVGTDPDADRHGIVCPNWGVMNPNHYIAVCVEYLFGGNRPGWPEGAAVGKTLVSSSLIDRVAASINAKVIEVPVGFKWFVDPLFSGEVAFGGEESSGMSFLRKDGRVWTTDKDGLIPDLLAAEITAKTGKNPAQLHQEQVERFGESWYKRVDTPTTLEQKAKFAALSGDDVTASTLAGEDITAKLTEAPGNHAKIGGLKVTTKDNWFAARPSGTENIYKVYAESFVSPEALDKVLDEATVVVDKALSE